MKSLLCVKLMALSLCLSSLASAAGIHGGAAVLAASTVGAHPTTKDGEWGSASAQSFLAKTKDIRSRADAHRAKLSDDEVRVALSDLDDLFAGRQQETTFEVECIERRQVADGYLTHQSATPLNIEPIRQQYRRFQSKVTITPANSPKGFGGVNSIALNSPHSGSTENGTMVLDLKKSENLSFHNTSYIDVGVLRNKKNIPQNLLRSEEAGIELIGIDDYAFKFERKEYGVNNSTDPFDIYYTSTIVCR